MKTQNNGQQALVPAGELVDFQPQWFVDALGQTAQDHMVAFNGASIHYRRWACRRANAPESAPTLMLVHGNGAHARWFDFIAPLLTDAYQVIAVDLPGMGDGGWLPDYSREILADAIIAMVRHADLPSKPAVIAHSFGGLVGLISAHRHPEALAALMICDFHIRPPELHEEWFEQITESRRLRVYETRAEAEARFRLEPDQPCANQFIVDYIAEHSIRQVSAGHDDGLRAIPKESGFTWKFDPGMYVGFRIGTDLSEIYQQIRIPLAAQFGAMSYDFDTTPRHQVVDYMRRLRPDAPHFDIVGAHHHIMLDQPHAFAASVRAMMESWRASGAFSTS